MSAALQWFLIAVGLVAIAALVLLIRRQWRQIANVRKAQARTRELQQERHDKMVESIRILAMTIEQEQVEPSEGCIRIKGLLDHVAPELLTQKPFEVFQVMYEKTEHMPTHEARRQTDPKTIRQLDDERFALEREYETEIREAAIAIRTHPLPETPDDIGSSGGEVRTVEPAKSTLQP